MEIQRCFRLALSVEPSEGIQGQRFPLVRVISPWAHRCPPHGPEVFNGCEKCQDGFHGVLRRFGLS